jgi:DNA repair exonuclease SbcCD ATPase subunit
MPYKDPEKHRQHNRERYHDVYKHSKDYKQERKKYAQQYHKEHWAIPEYREREAARRKLTQRKTGIKYRYGLTIEDFFNLYKAQDGACPICGEPLNQESKTTVVDHDHVTGKIRGVVHHKCNTAIGYVERFRDRLQAILEYLDAGEESNKPLLYVVNSARANG